MKKIAITTGDPAGIGPEIVCKALRFYTPNPETIYIIYGNIEPDPVLARKIKQITEIEAAESNKYFYHIPIEKDSITKGMMSKKSGQVAYNILKRCSRDLKKNKIDAVVTCPISKTAIQMTYPYFIGHTEFFARISNVDNVVMSFWGKKFNIALLTTHCSIKDVPEKINEEILEKKLSLIYKEMVFIKQKPKLAILGVNPHAGENGAFGKTDELIKQVLAKLRQKEIKIDGPYPADTFFSNKVKNYDLIISAYHDQGLIPFKMMHPHSGINVTLGLPFIRTSVDHGTAFDIAGKNKANEASLLKALCFAETKISSHSTYLDNNYFIFSKFYDNYMSHVNYQKWARFIINQYLIINDKYPEKIHELACGTANISSILVKNKYKVYASDLSAAMLREAFKKRHHPCLYNHDMLNKIPENNNDIIVLMYDSINYLTSKKEIKILFDNVARALHNEGIFIFDIATEKNCAEYFKNYLNVKEYDDTIIIHESYFSEKNKNLETILTFFIDKGLYYEKKQEKHLQKIYPVKRLVSLIRKSNLDLKFLYVNEGQMRFKEIKSIDNIDKEYPRIYFVLQAKKSRLI